MSAIELHLFRQAEAAWTGIARPWLEARRGELRRDYVVVSTRGQAHALKQRCLVEGVPLFGVEFLTPGLARKKWLAPDKPGLGRELLLAGLRLLIEKKIAALGPADLARGFWQSLQSDPGRALDDFDELLKAGFRSEDFPLAPLREIFGRLEAWCESLGYALAPRQNEAAALTLPPAGTPAVADRLLVFGLTAESWGEFFNVAALARHCREIAVVLPEPEFRGSRALEERWIEVWSALLGTTPRVIDAPSFAEASEVRPVRVLVGETRADEMALVADEISALLAAGADNIAVIFPRADAAHARLARLLTERGIAFANLLETAAPPPLEAQAQRALLEFYRNGGRLEELLPLWPLLAALGQVKAPLAAVREACEQVFDECHAHTLDGCAQRLLADRSEAARELGRLASHLPPWPAELTIGQALARFSALCEKFFLPRPPGWAALERFAEKDTALWPGRLALEAAELFLPERGPAAEAAGKGNFARVTLTTRRRAEGAAWSHVIFVESNAGVWPVRHEPSPWLTDEQRDELNRRGRFSLGLFTSEDRAALERQSIAALMRDAHVEVIFSAARADETDPELPLAPNRFVERALLDKAGVGSLETEWARYTRCRIRPARPAPPDWLAVWKRRRDRGAPFDEHFFCGPTELRPDSLSAGLIERGVCDPAELWFDAILGVRRVEWRPLVRSRQKSLGLLAHRVVAAAWATGGTFGPLPAAEEARERLGRALTELRARWPQDRYWDSFHAELKQKAEALLDQALRLRSEGFAAAELPLRDASLQMEAGARISVRGRLDLVLLDRSNWRGAQADIVDFKTGSDEKLSARRMAEHGDSLQLGVYLAAALSLGAAGGRVWMLKPDEPPSSLAAEELPTALKKMEQLGRHLATGRYGALTPDRTGFIEGRPWPLACAPIGYETLVAKFELTFPAQGGAS